MMSLNVSTCRMAQYNWRRPSWAARLWTMGSCILAYPILTLQIFLRSYVFFSRSLADICVSSRAVARCACPSPQSLFQASIALCPDLNLKCATGRWDGQTTGCDFLWGFPPGRTCLTIVDNTVGSRSLSSHFLWLQTHHHIE